MKRFGRCRHPHLGRWPRPGCDEPQDRTPRLQLQRTGRQRSGPRRRYETTLAAGERRCCLVESRLEIRRWNPVILSGSQHDDCVSRKRRLLPAREPNLRGGDCEVHHDHCEQRRHDFQRNLEGKENHPVARSSATPRRRRTSSRPSKLRDSKSGGPTERPVTATLIGA